MHKLLGVALLGIITGSRPTAAWAVDDAVKLSAREIGREGIADYDAGRYADASRKLLQAFEVVKLPTVGLWAGRALAKQGRLVAAIELMRQSALLTPNELWVGASQQQAQRDANLERDALMQRVARLRLTFEGVQPAELTVTIDGVAIPAALIQADQFVDPGKRQIVAKRGGDVIEQTVTTQEGERANVVLRFGQPAPVAAARPESPRASSPRGTVQQIPESSSMRTVGWIALGVGAAGFAVGTTTGVMLATRYSDLNSDCPQQQCIGDAPLHDRADGFNSLRTWTTASLVVGGIATATGITLLLTHPRHRSESNVSLAVTANAFSVRGAF